MDYKCIGPTKRIGNDQRPFDAGVHIRSLRYDFEPFLQETWHGGLQAAWTTNVDRPDITHRWRRNKWEDQKHSIGSDNRNTSSDPRYNLTEWRELARSVLNNGIYKEIYIASDNAPARNELAARLVEAGGTALCDNHQSAGGRQMVFH